jgi:hypothetical protein
MTNQTFVETVARVPVFVKPGYYEGEFYKPDPTKVHKFEQEFKNQGSGFFESAPALIASLAILLGEIRRKS